MSTINGKACVANGRNLLTGTADKIVTGSGSNTYGYLSNETVDDLLVLFQGLEGQTVTLSVDYEYSGFVAGSSQNRIGWEVETYADTITYHGSWYFPDNDSGSGRISATFVVPKNITRVAEAQGYIQFSGSGTGTLSNLKLEKGSVSTPLTPAPVDKVFSDGKQVYGRNYFLDSNFYLTTTGENRIQKPMSIPQSALNGRTVTVSVEIDVDNVTALSGTGSNRAGFELRVSFIGGGYKYIGVWWEAHIGDSYHGRISTTNDLSGLEFIDQRDNIYDQGTYVQGFSADKIKVGRPKFEFSNKATDWTPAPEDILK